MEIFYLSTTRLAKERGLQTAEMFELLTHHSLIIRVEEPKKWELTEKGKLVGGRYKDHPEFGEYIEWPHNLDVHNEQPTVIKEKTFVYQKSADTEGEKYIKEFFREVGIKYKFQETIRNLSHDIKGHRVADFYLPKYDAYVEFFGHWNTNNEYRENYKLKKKIYKKNHIPCVFLYPENLGVIDFSFDHRLTEALRENHKDEELRKYKKWKFFKGAKENFFGLSLCLIFFLIMYLTKEQGKAIIGFLFFYNAYKIIKTWYLVYVMQSYSIARMRYD